MAIRLEKNVKEGAHVNYNLKSACQKLPGFFYTISFHLHFLILSRVCLVFQDSTESLILILTTSSRCLHFSRILLGLLEVGVHCLLGGKKIAS
jgi:hypothetical protein